MSFSLLPAAFAVKAYRFIGDLREKIDYKLSDFQRTTNLTQHTVSGLLKKWS